MFSLPLALSDEYVREVANDRRREAEHEWLVAQAIGPGRPVRARVANWLFAIARRVEGEPRAAPAGARV